MNRLFFILIFVTSLSFSQDFSIEIQLESDSLVYTNWIELNDLPYIKKPYILIHGHDGIKINIQDLVRYKGIDQYGDYRYLEKTNLRFHKSYSFTERTFSFDSTKKLQLYQDRLKFGGLDVSSKMDYQYYSINNSTKKNLNYSNVSRELFNNPRGEDLINSANQIRIFQTISACLGVAMITTALMSNSAPENVGEFSINDNLLLFGGSALIVLPFTLEKAKTRNLKDALRTIN